MIMEREILNGQECPEEFKENLLELLIKINKVRDAFGREMTVSSGFRSKRKHLAIYRKKGITDPKKIPMKSRHLTCQAVDIFDPQKKLQKWVKDNILLVEQIGLWVEDFSSTPDWIHFQTIPPLSGKRFFFP